ncbi:MAG: hypothetical protein AB1478_12255, partial [Nitrospirota bacterium]
MDNRISFFELLRQCLIEDLRDKRYISLIPWFLAICIGIGFVAAYYLPISIFNRSDYLVLITGLIAAQGIMLGMSTNAIQHVVQNISSPGFSTYLKECNILQYYLFFIQYFQYVGIIALIALIISAIILISCTDVFIVKIALALSFGLV